MNYCSTRNSGYSVSAAQAIVAGLAPDGGLFVPESLPEFTPEELQSMVGMDYTSRAVLVLSKFLTDFTQEELREYVSKAYASSKFQPKEVAPLHRLDREAYVLELFHGPTCAFKDFALQLLPYLLTASMRKTGVDHQVVILVATSGDTGKAALEGFADVPGTRICVFYPDGGTSNIQRLQMTTQQGENVMVYGVKGNFDDAQNGVKRIFTDQPFQKELEQRGYVLSSANSINWGRLVPQIVYYFSAYCQLVAQGQLTFGEKVNFVVPTGNFGNILAAYIAKKCGLPVNKLVCASNQNNVLTDFIRDGFYDRNREFFLTMSPSMDILISSNLERLLYLLCGRDDTQVRDLMGQLTEKGRYTIGADLLAKLKEDFQASYADDWQTDHSIHETNKAYQYVCDPHTGVALKTYMDYTAYFGDHTLTVIDSTASPFKFPTCVLKAIGHLPQGDDFQQLEQLSQATGLPVPENLAKLRDLPERFTQTVAPEDMKSAVDSWLR